MPDFCDRHHPSHLVMAIAWLTKQGIDLSRVFLKAIGEFYNYRGEIHGQIPGPGEFITDETLIHLDVGIESLVDYFPYQLFYGLPGLSSTAGSEWEDSGRRLVSTFDAAVTILRTLASYEVLKYSCPEVDADQSVRATALFGDHGFPRQLACGNGRTWLPVLSSFHLWSGNAEGTARFLSRVLGHAVEIVENVESAQRIKPELQSRLGSKYARLGEDLVIGDSFKERESAFEVRISELPLNEATDWLTPGGRYVILKNLLEATTPSCLDFRIRPVFAAGPVRLGRDGKEAFLGLSAMISSGHNVDANSVLDKLTPGP